MAFVELREEGKRGRGRIRWERGERGVVALLWCLDFSFFFHGLTFLFSAFLFRIGLGYHKQYTFYR